MSSQENITFSFSPVVVCLSSQCINIINHSIDVYLNNQIIERSLQIFFVASSLNNMGHQWCQSFSREFERIQGSGTN